MDFFEIILGVLGGGAVAGIVTLYNAKANNTSIQADTFKKFFDEVQEWTRNEIQQQATEIKDLKEERKVFIKDFDEYKESNRREIEKVREENAIKDCAINSAYKCVWTDDLHNCPVIKTLDELVAKTKEEG